MNHGIVERFAALEDAVDRLLPIARELYGRDSDLTEAEWQTVLDVDRDRNVFTFRRPCEHGRWEAHGMRGKPPNRCDGGDRIEAGPILAAVAALRTALDETGVRIPSKLAEAVDRMIVQVERLAYPPSVCVTETHR